MRKSQIYGIAGFRTARNCIWLNLGFRANRGKRRIYSAVRFTHPVWHKSCCQAAPKSCSNHASKQPLLLPLFLVLPSPYHLLYLQSIKSKHCVLSCFVGTTAVIGFPKTNPVVFGLLMEASSPSPSAKVGESLMANAAVNGNLKFVTFDTPKQNLRGLNKPKCSKCGNVARSRCPFQSCKSCCAKAQNPCPIHVLKQNGTLPDPSSTIPSFEPHPTDAPSSGASWRLTSLRQLSTAVANSLRARKALTRKDAININKWRFLKLREHIEGNIEVENEAFERYLNNVSLLEEAFSASDELYTLEDVSDEKIQKLVTSMKVNLKSNPRRVDTIRKRIRNLVNEKLRKLLESEHISDNISVSVNDDELDAYMDLKRPKKLDENRVEKIIETDNLIDKLNKARNKDELISCMEMKSQLFGHSKNETFKLSNDKCAEDDHIGMKKEFGGAVDSSFAQPKLCTVVHINQDLISDIDCGISWPPQLAEL